MGWGTVTSALSQVEGATPEGWLSQAGESRGRGSNRVTEIWDALNKVCLRHREHLLISQIFNKVWQGFPQRHTLQMTGRCSPVRHRRYPPVKSKGWGTHEALF